MSRGEPARLGIRAEAEQRTRDLVVALRGQTTQLAASRRLGFTSNVVHRWESGQRSVPAEALFAWTRTRGVDPGAVAWEVTSTAIPTLLGPAPSSALDVFTALTNDVGTSRAADDLQVPVAAVGRLLRGETQLKFVDLLCLLEARTGLSATFVAAVATPDNVRGATEAAVPWTQARTLQCTHPFVPALLRCVRGSEQPTDVDALAHGLGEAADRVSGVLETLTQMGQVAMEAGRVVPSSQEAPPLPALPDHPTGRRYWSDKVAAQLQVGRGLASFSMVSLEPHHVADVRQSLHEALQAARRMDAPGIGKRCVVVVSQLVSMDGQPPGAHVPDSIEGSSSSPHVRTPQTNPQQMHYEATTTELLRALRGGQTQGALSKRLGFTSNVVHRWEAGQRAVPADVVLTMARWRGVDPVALVHGIYMPAKVSLLQDAPDLAHHLFRCLVSDASFEDVQALSGMSVDAITRRIRGTASVTFVDVLRVLDAVSWHAPEFVAGLAQPDAVHSAQQMVVRRAHQRRFIQDHPVVPALLLLIDTPMYRRLPQHDPAWLSHALGEPVDDVVDALLDSGLVRREDGWLVPGAAELVDHGEDRDAYRRTTAYWSAKARDRVDDGLAEVSFAVLSLDDVAMHAVGARLAEAIHATSRIGVASTHGRCVCSVVQVAALDGLPLNLGRRESNEEG